MVAAVRRGISLRSVARKFRVCLRTVQRWVKRAEGERLDRVDFSDRPPIPQSLPSHIDREMEDLVLSVRQRLRESSDLGEFGAEAIRRELLAQARSDAPSVRTINRILDRRGAFDTHRRLRRPPPPLGWYLPDVALKSAELDQFDVVDGLALEGGFEVEVFNAVSLHGGLIESWPEYGVTAKSARSALIEHWQQVGLPTYAQFDNDTRFQGPHHYPDVIGSVSRLCLSLKVVPVFAPQRETGFQAAIEAYNGRWQSKVWARYHFESMEALQLQSAKYVAAYRKRAAPRIESAPDRRPFPQGWELDLQAHPRGRMIFLRRTNANGQIRLFGHTFEVDTLWTHRLVRCDVNLDAGVISFYALRRRQPGQQPLLGNVAYVLPRRRFTE